MQAAAPFTLRPSLLAAAFALPPIAAPAVAAVRAFLDRKPRPANPAGLCSKGAPP
jgi:hypothetical protein